MSHIPSDPMNIDKLGENMDTNIDLPSSTIDNHQINDNDIVNQRVEAMRGEMIENNTINHSANAQSNISNAQHHTNHESNTHHDMSIDNSSSHVRDTNSEAQNDLQNALDSSPQNGSASSIDFVPPHSIQTFNHVVKQLITSPNVVDVLVVDQQKESTEPLPYQNKEISPNNTIYINHLNEKITVNNLRILLQSLCEHFGKILSIHVHDAMKRKGQAWVVYDNVESAKLAVKALHGIEIDGKRIGVQFSVSTSDPIAKRLGTFELQKRQREIERRMNAGVEQFQREMKRRRLTSTGYKKVLPVVSTATIAASGVPSRVEGPLPHRILLVQGLSDSITKDDLEELFSNFPGFEKVRFIAAKKVAFIDFDSEQNATLALDADGMKIKESSIQVSYAKK